MMQHSINGAQREPNRTRIAFFLPNLRGGGAERVSINLANGIAQRDYDVDIVAASAQGAFQSAIRSGITVVDLKAPRILSSIRPLAAYLHARQPNVLVAALHANFAALLAKRLSRSSTRIAVTQHSHMSVYAGSGGWKVRAEPQMARLMFPRADITIAVSEGVADDLSSSSGIPRQQIDALYNPVIMPELAAKKAVTPQHSWFESGHPPIILAAGRLVELKGFRDLIDAFATVRAQRPARLMILGEGPERGNLEQQAHNLGLSEDVNLPGFVDNPYAYMTHADLFVLSSIFEGLPTVLVEALYCDLPVVATDCPSGPFEILAGGRYGRLVPPQDSNALAASIQAALDGDVPAPEPASWQPYEMNHVIDQYLAVLLPRAASPERIQTGESHDEST